MTSNLIRYALALEYTGDAFSGFQLQANAYTVQQAVEEALFKCFQIKCRIAGTSRTDAGVHAKAQVAIVDLNKSLSCERLMAALNSILPKSVRVIDVQRKPLDWNPRYQARSKIYHYLIYNRAVSSPFWEGRAYQLYKPLNIRAMRQGAKHLIGQHDFSSFQASGCSAKDPVRRIRKITIQKRNDVITCGFEGDGFLYHMVRNIIGSLVKVGLGTWSPEHIKEILEMKDRKCAGPTAPACGLYLEKIIF